MNCPSSHSAYFGLVISEPKEFVDHRGNIIVWEHHNDHAFVARRTFFISFAQGGLKDKTRAEHAPSCNQMLVVLRGEVRVDLDNGSKVKSVTCTPFGKSLLVLGGVWRRVVAVEEDSCLAVLADASYAETQYFHTPMPHLIEANARNLLP